MNGVKDSVFIAILLSFVPAFVFYLLWLVQITDLGEGFGGGILLCVMTLFGYPIALIGNIVGFIISIINWRKYRARFSILGLILNSVFLMITLVIYLIFLFTVFL